MKSVSVSVGVQALACLLSASLHAQIVINEIIYNPLSHDPREEYVELLNTAGTNVNLSGWTISGGIDFAFPTNTILGPGRYLVVAAHRPTFTNSFPTVTNVVGSWLTLSVLNVNGRMLTNWNPVLANSRNSINLNNAAGERVDDVTYADSGDWAVRQYGPPTAGRRGWIWHAAPDGLGSSLELRNPNLPNEFGQNWLASPVGGPTPGRLNAAATSNIPPMVLDVRHAPTIPRSTDPVSITARVIDESASGLSVFLHYRVEPDSFATTQMLDDGNNGDASENDGIYGVILSALPNDALVEFYVEASDAQANTRTWPAPADVDGVPTQSANAMFQVDNTIYSGTPPTYKLVMTTAQFNELQTLFNSAPNSDAQVNATFISIDSTGIERHYLCGVRNRGHGSRSGTPHNYRVNFPDDDRWKGVSGYNINARGVAAQVVGAAVAQKAGAAGHRARFVQLRVNNGNGPGGVPANGLYAGNEDIDGNWAERQFPNNGEGNIYSVVRDLPPSPYPNFDYRDEDVAQYRRTYVKQSNIAEDDWQDIMGMLFVMGEDQTNSFDIDAARQVADIDQWLVHLAVMSLFGNNESGVNTGNNDDYYWYRGDKDPRFVFVYHDLDSVLGIGSLGATEGIFRATCCPISGDSEGIWRAMDFFMRHPEIQPLYYRTLQNLLDSTFSAAQFNAIVDSLCGDIPALVGNANTMKNYMNNRRNFVQGVINGLVPPPVETPLAIVAGEPRSPTWRTTATLTVSGAGLSQYQWRLNTGAWSAVTPIATPITISGLANGSTNTVSVSGRFTNGLQQGVATVSRTWVVNTAIPAVRLNEVLARDNDEIELYNEGASAVNLSGLRLSDDPADPNKFVFPPTTTLATGAYLTLDAAELGFSLEGSGEAVYLFNAAGTAVLDSVAFGPQLPNLSIGRFGAAGAWSLTQPTLGATNIAQATGSSSGVRINEWLAVGSVSNPDDLIELFNTGSLPASLAGHYLTDNPLGFPTMHRIPELSFIGAGSFLVFTADGDATQPDHVNFQLAGEQGEIGLFSPRVTPIDCITYGPQRRDISAGRCPDGIGTIRTLVIPTLGVANLCPAPPIPPQMINVMPFTNTWRFHQNTNLDGINWQAPAFNDSTWSNGLALFGVGNPTPEVVRTPLTTGGNRVTYYFRSTFTVSGGLTPTSLQFSNIIDDGAVFYINGREVARYNFAPGTQITYNTLAQVVSGAPGWTTLPIAATNIQAGLNHIAVEVHQNLATSPDIFFGARLDALIVTNDPVAAGVTINEIFANNASFTNLNGATPDFVELYNPSTNAVDLAGMSFSDDILNNPRRWVLPPGTIVPASGYLVLQFDGDELASATNSGFGLGADGDKLFLLTAQTQVLDSITFGVQIEDYSIGRVTNGGPNWVLTLPTLGSGNAPAPLGDLRQVRVNEWMPRPASGDDWFELYNPEPLPVAIGDCHVSDDGNPIKHQIAALSFLGAGTNAWKRFIADNNVGAGANHVGFRLDNSAEGVSFADANGGVLHSITYSGPAPGVAEGFLPDGSATRYLFPGTESPNEPNYLALADIVINEVLSHTDAPLEDAIELRNLSAAPVNIGGWWLSDSRRVLQKCQIPADTVIAAGGYAVFYEVRFNNTDQAAIPFGLSSSDGDQVQLSSILGNGALSGYRATADFGAAANGVSFGRYENSVGLIDYPALSRRTFGQDNAFTVEDFRTGTGLSNAYPLVGPIVITEIMYRPPDIGAQDNVLHEFVELHNLTANAVALYDPAHPTNTWRLRDAVDFDFPFNTSIPPGGYILVVAFDPVNDPDSLASFQGVYGTNSALFGPYSGKLDNSSDNVELYKPDAPSPSGQVPYIEVERVKYADQPPWPLGPDGLGESLQRVSITSYANEPANWLGAPPTPGPSAAADNDSDGMPNSWELANNLNPNNEDDAEEDADEDGFTNLQEYRAGTNPRDAQSHLRLGPVASVPGATMLEFHAAAGITYSIMYRTALQIGLWTKLIDIPAQPTAQMLRVFDPSADPKRFYLLVTPSQ